MADYLFTYRKGYPDGESIQFNADWSGLIAVTVRIVTAYLGLPGISQFWCVGSAIVVRILLNCIGSDSPAKVYYKD